MWAGVLEFIESRFGFRWLVGQQINNRQYTDAVDDYYEYEPDFLFVLGGAPEGEAFPYQIPCDQHNKQRCLHSCYIV